MFGQISQQIDVSALFIAAFGALFSIASALYFTSRKISSEFAAKRVELTYLYSREILSKRLECYPRIWCHICSFEKIVRGFPDSVGPKQVCKFHHILHFNEMLAEWDNQFGLVLSAKSAIAYERTRRAARDVLQKMDFDKSDALVSDADAQAVLSCSSRLELALRIDIGIYEVDKAESRKIFHSYDDANLDAIGRRHKASSDWM